MRVHGGISANPRVDDILMNGRVCQGYGLPVGGNSQLGGLTVVAFTSGKPQKRQMNGYRSESRDTRWVGEVSGQDEAYKVRHRER